jgi:outer membrane protein assembly factor BamB
MRTHTLLPTALLVSFLHTALLADDWPQWRGPGRDGVWRETGIIEKFDEPQIKLRWRTEISSGYTGPTVANGRVYVMDRVTEPEEIERVHCFDWTDGRKIWSHVYPCKYDKVYFRAGPRAAVTIDDGRAYSLGTMGHFFCFDAATGEVLWKKDPTADFQVRLPVWGIAAAPLIEGNMVILQIGGDNGACVVALDKKTGVRQWAALDDPASYSAPIVIDQADRRVLVCWTGARLVGLNPASGELYWEQPFRHSRYIDMVGTPVVYKNLLFVCTHDEGSLMMRLDRDSATAEELWRRGNRSLSDSDALHSLMSTPELNDGHIYGVDRRGELRCLEAATGNRIWEDLTATTIISYGMLHMVRNRDKTWIFNDRGELLICRLSPTAFEESTRATLQTRLHPQ